MLIEQLTGVDITGLHDEYGAVFERVVAARQDGLGWVGSAGPGSVVEVMRAVEDGILPGLV